MTAIIQLCTHKSACIRRLKYSPPTAPLSRRASDFSAKTTFRAFVPTPSISFRGSHICRNGGSFFEDQNLSASEDKEVPPPEPVLPPGVLFMEGNENNIIRVVEIPADAGIALAGARLLMLDHTNNVHSIYQPSSETLLSTAYWDVMGCLPPLLPVGGTLGWLGLGAGTGAHLINKYFPQQRQEGWELDATVLEASRKFMGLAELESGDDPLEVHLSNAFEAHVEDGFSGLIVDLFTHGRVLPELLEADTWTTLAERLQPEGYIMANLGGSAGADAQLDEDATNALTAMRNGLSEEMTVYVKQMEGMSCNTMALAGKQIDFKQWRSNLPDCLGGGLDGWQIVEVANEG